MLTSRVILLNARRRPFPWLASFCAAVLLLVVQGCGSSARAVQAQSVGHTESGVASYYGNEYQSRKTASGEIFDQAKMTAAHRTLPFGTRLKVTNTRNSKSVVVRVNDRGPFVKGRIVDLSSSAFKHIANLNEGVAPARIEIIH